MDFGIMFFSSDGSSADEPYRLLLEAARFADRHGFVCVWTPERHFHEFGGQFANPALTSAALATITERLQLRAGSLISPLHDPLRIAEEWAVVDGLSGGRAAVSFGSGWNADDFAFFPDRYDRRREIMVEQLETVRHLWSGGTVERTNGRGVDRSLAIAPRPVQEELPVWLTSSGNPQTFAEAGSLGANLLTHLIGQSLDELGDKIALYRRSRAEAGHDPETGLVSLMLHTYLGDDAETVRRLVRQPFREYLRSAVSLERMAALDGGSISGGHQVEPHEISDAAMEELLDLTFERYYRDASLLGTADDREDFVWRLADLGIDEVACLIDFGVDAESVLEGLRHLDDLRARFDAEALERRRAATIDAFVGSFDE